MAFAEDYVPVNERIEAFYAAHPEGSIQCEIHTLTDGLVIVRASAYRTPDDTRPSIAHSMMSIPGKTNFTRGSEVENAETSAVGRAIAMLGFEVKRGIATREDVANKTPLPDAQELPEWVHEFNKNRKDRGITPAQLSTVIGRSATLTNIEIWLAGDESRTPDKLLSLAADLKP